VTLLEWRDLNTVLKAGGHLIAGVIMILLTLPANPLSNTTYTVDVIKIFTSPYTIRLYRVQQASFG
jgi:hypothetical protein